MLKPREGWAYTRGLIADAHKEFLLRYAALRAARFLWDALSRDLGVAIPFGSFLPFDVVVMTAANNYRVQVKYTTTARSAGWIVNVQRAGGVRYQKGDFDILAALDPNNTWYIIPFDALQGRKAIRLPRRPQFTRNETGFPAEKYRERWELFK